VIRVVASRFLGRGRAVAFLASVGAPRRDFGIIGSASGIITPPVEPRRFVRINRCRCNHCCGRLPKSAVQAKVMLEHSDRFYSNRAVAVEGYCAIHIAHYQLGFFDLVRDSTPTEPD